MIVKQPQPKPYKLALKQTAVLELDEINHAL